MFTSVIYSQSKLFCLRMILLLLYQIRSLCNSLTLSLSPSLSVFFAVISFSLSPHVTKIPDSVARALHVAITTMMMKTVTSHFVKQYEEYAKK